MIDLLDQPQISHAKAQCTLRLSVAFQGLGFTILADNKDILDYLTAYYSGLADDSVDANSSDKRLFLINQQPDFSAGGWRPIERARISPSGFKEAYTDTLEGRWIHKVRTGMAMFQSLSDPLVVGNLNQNPSQVVNFINNQFLNHFQHQNYLLGHAAAFTLEGNTTAIAASSGGGKSTLMLKVLESTPARFLSNDRILFQPENGEVIVVGLPKHPRVNPGTLINSAKLVHLLPGAERAQFASMPARELWDIEQKYDVLIPQCYGENKVLLSGSLKKLILLDWSPLSSAPTELHHVDIEQQPEALEGLRKSPGPFFQNADGRFPDLSARACEYYASYLKGVEIFRLTGKADFDSAFELLQTEGML